MSSVARLRRSLLACLRAGKLTYLGTLSPRPRPPPPRPMFSTPRIGKN